MKRQRLLFLALVLLLSFVASRGEPPKEHPLLIENLSPGMGELIWTEDLAIATNGVKITYGDAELTAQRATANLDTGQVHAEGNVHLRQGTQVWRFASVDYHFKTRELHSGSFRSRMGPFLAAGQTVSGMLSNQVYAVTNAVLTTDDVANPFYKIKAQSIRVVPGESIEAKNATAYIGPIPLMYFPYYHRALHRHPNNFQFTPGYRSLFGPYLLSSYHWYWSDQLSGALHVDYRQKRGAAIGPDVEFDYGRWGNGNLGVYYLRDDAPGKDNLGNAIPENRQRVRFSYQANLLTNLTAKVVANEQSDVQMIRDFFEPDHRRNPQPKSFLEVNQTWPNFSLNVLALPQLNDFFQTVERLPDIKLSALRQQLGVSPFYYESETSAGYFRFRPAERLGTNYTGLRGDTFHQISVPWNFFGWLNVTPRVGGRFTRYDQVEGLKGVDSEINRAVFNTGTEVSFKASRVWPGAESDWLEVNGLRHILQPSFNYAFVPRPTARPRELPQFDTEIPSFRLLPIDFPDFNAIDAIDSQNVLRLGLRNKFQTKRKERVGRKEIIDNLLNWDLYTDWRLSRRPGQGQFADVFSDLDFKPRSWIVFNSETRLDADTWKFRLASHSVTLLPNDVWSVSLGHRYFRQDPAFGPNSGNNLIFDSIYFRFNENWAGRMSHHFEARDGVLEEQYYTLYRDLRSWTGALTFRVRNNRLGKDDYTVAVTFSLKAFPRFKLGRDRDDPSYLVGG